MNKLLQHFQIFIILFFLCGLDHTPLFAQSALQKSIDQFARDEVLRYGTAGIAVIDINSGKLIAQHNAYKSQVPASLQKTMTTASALAILGPSFTFETLLQYDGAIDAGGILRGNIYIKGSGDPTLGSNQMDGTPDLDELMKKFRLALQQRGIRRIEGYIVGDASIYPTASTSATWQWNDLGNYYGAGVWGLNMHENLYYLRFRQVSRLGSTPSIALIEPEVTGLTFVNEVTSASAGSGDNAYIYGGPYSYDRFVRGTIPIGSGIFSIKGSIPDPPLFAAKQLENHLRSVGIICEKGAITDLGLQGRLKDQLRKTLYTHQSPPLREIVERTNMESVNLYAEALLRAIGYKIKGKGAIDAGLEAIEAYWEGRGLSFDGCFFEDGSGLSSRNGVTAIFMASMMRKVAKFPDIYPAFYQSLPVSGQSGGMKYTLRGTAAAGKVRAKTGTLKRIRGLTGFVETRSGKQLAFCIMANNFTGSGGSIRGKMEQILLAMYQSS